MSELQVNTIRPVSGTVLTVSNNTNLTVSGAGKVTTPVVEATDLDINGTNTLELKHNGNTKINVTSTGATVTGTLAATAFSGDGSALTGVVSAGSGGSSSTGSLNLISDSDQSGSGDIVFQTGATERGRIYLSSGNVSFDNDVLLVDAQNNRVGVNKSSPQYALDVSGTVQATSVAASGNATIGGTLAVNGSSITTTSTGAASVFNTNALTLNLGQAATTVSVGATTGTTTIRNNVTVDGYLGVGGTAAYPLYVFDSSNNYIAYIRNDVNSASKFGIVVDYRVNGANSTSSYPFAFYDSTATIYRFYVRSNGGISNYSANDVSLSDARLKKDIRPTDSKWDKIKAIEIVDFKFIDQTHDDNNVGVIAQQVETVFPSLVEENPISMSGSETAKSVYANDLMFCAIKALQEAMLRIESLEQRIALA